MAETDINNSTAIASDGAGLPANFIDAMNAPNAPVEAPASASQADAVSAPSAHAELEEGINDVQLMIDEVNAQFATSRNEQAVLAAADAEAAAATSAATEGETSDTFASPSASASATPVPAQPQSQTPTLSFSKSSSASSSGPDSPPSSTAAATIAAVDQALAHDIDDLLQGDFESIDAVLQATYDPPVGEAAMPGAPKPEPVGRTIHAPAMTIEPLTTAASLQGALGGGSKPHAVESASAEDDLSDIATFESPASMEDDAAERTIAAAPSDETSVAAARDGAEATSDSNVASDPSVETGKPSETSPVVAAVEAISEMSAAIVKTASTAKSSLKISLSASEALSAVLQPLIGLLTLINFPLRLVPAKTRLLLNWTALTMIAWVPVVWIMLMVGGGESSSASASPAPANHESKATKQEAPKHEASKGESSGHGKAAGGGHGSGH